MKSPNQRAKKDEWQQAFLKAYAELGTVTHACTAVGIDRSTPHVAAKRDPVFAEAFASAREAAADRLERVAIRRAEDSSDVLLIFLLKALRPEKFRENVKVEHSGQVQLNEVLFADAWPKPITLPSTEVPA